MHDFFHAPYGPLCASRPASLASPCQGEGREFESLHPLFFHFNSFYNFLLAFLNIFIFFFALLYSLFLLAFLSFSTFGFHLYLFAYKFIIVNILSFDFHVVCLLYLPAR